VVKVRKEKYFEEERKRLREEKAKGKSFFLIIFLNKVLESSDHFGELY
jgi:molecular chaperone GrpE (heat shock protein)